MHICITLQSTALWSELWFLNCPAVTTMIVQLTVLYACHQGPRPSASTVRMPTTANMATRPLYSSPSNCKLVRSQVTIRSTADFACNVTGKDRCLTSQPMRLCELSDSSGGFPQVAPSLRGSKPRSPAAQTSSRGPSGKTSQTAWLGNQATP